MRNLIILLISPLFLVSITFGDEIWRGDLNKLIAATSTSEQDSLIAKIARENPSWQQLREALSSLTYPRNETDKFVLEKSACIDNIERPYVIYIPPSYSPDISTTLVVFLHGSVSRADIRPDPVGWARNIPIVKTAEKEGWILLFPFGQAGATWWDDVGISNVLNQIRLAKTNYNIDDNRVFLSGFSDGGSAAYMFAMALPSDFAGFIALNGNMGVASHDGNLPTYASNFINTPVYAVSTDKDQLYPTAETERFIAMAQSAGAKIEYRKLSGEHSFSYADSELPLITNWVKKQVRDPFPNELFWEAALPGFGVCHWFAIDEITDAAPAAWYHDYNAAYIDSSITIGIIPDDEYTGTGVRVANAVDGDYLSRRIGLQAGDIIIKAGGIAVKDMDSLAAFKRTLRRGDPVSLVIRRDNSELTLRGRMPANENYFLFKRDQPSAAARVSVNDNTVDIESSRLGAFRIFINPEMFDLDRKIIIRVDGKLVYNSTAGPDISYLLHDFLLNRDRRILYVNEIAVNLK